VHGSLARAGKVRGQTPKVPPQEKKKKPTGRACKRMKYNRRFVNVGACAVAVSCCGRGGRGGESAVLPPSYFRGRRVCADSERETCA
jgi:small subunit ribosomal protein S30e